VNESSKLSRASSRVRWLNGKYGNVSRTFSVLVISELFPAEENRDDCRNVNILAEQPRDAQESFNK
jgi:hypothetical protein